MKNIFFVLFLMFSMSSVRSDELKQNIKSSTATVEIGENVKVIAQREPVFRNVIVNFSITPGDSSPPSLILSGKVVSNNTGIGIEFVPVFFASTLHLPRLAALTNVKGEFLFRVWLQRKPDTKPSHRLEAADIKDSTLYLGGEFNEKTEMPSSYTHIHSLGEFLQNSSAQVAMPAIE